MHAKESGKQLCTFRSVLMTTLVTLKQKVATFLSGKLKKVVAHILYTNICDMNNGIDYYIVLIHVLLSWSCLLHIRTYKSSVISGRMYFNIVLYMQLLVSLA